jgi:hypothetical protein
MKLLLSFALLLPACSATSFGFVAMIESAQNPELIEINIGSDDGLKAGEGLTVFREYDICQIYVGQLEVRAVSAEHAACRTTSTTPNLSPQRGDHVFAVAGHGKGAGQVATLTVATDGSIELLDPERHKSERLLIYRATPAGIVETGRVKVIKADKQRPVCKVISRNANAPIRTGDHIATIPRRRVQSVEKDVVTVWLGTEDGVSKGSRFWVFRKSDCGPIGDYVGQIEAAQIDADSCTCKVAARGTNLAIQRGDVIIPDGEIPSLYKEKMDRCKRP